MPTTLYPPISEEGQVLPAELRAKFQKIKDISRAQRHLQEQQKQGGKKGEDENCQDETRPNKTEAAKDLEQLKLKLAAETAVACESEISRLAKGVAELEDLLSRRAISSTNTVAITFPSLPSVIPNDDVDEA